MITFEMIRDLERIERDNKAIQRLPENFITDLQIYLGKKENSMDIESIRLSINRLFEIRLRKLLEASIYKIHTDQRVPNVIALEDGFINKIIELIRSFQKSLLENERTERKKEEDVKQEKDDIPQTKTKTEKKEDQDKKIKDETMIDIKTNNIHTKETNENNTDSNIPIQKEVYRAIKSLPAFVGPDLKVYDLKEGDIIDAPKPLIDLLLKEGIIALV